MSTTETSKHPGVEPMKAIHSFHRLLCTVREQDLLEEFWEFKQRAESDRPEDALQADVVSRWYGLTHFFRQNDPVALWQVYLLGVTRGLQFSFDELLVQFRECVPTGTGVGRNRTKPTYQGVVSSAGPSCDDGYNFGSGLIYAGLPGRSDSLSDGYPYGIGSGEGYTYGAGSGEGYTYGAGYGKLLATDLDDLDGTGHGRFDFSYGCAYGEDNGDGQGDPRCSKRGE